MRNRVIFWQQNKHRFSKQEKNLIIGGTEFRKFGEESRSKLISKETKKRE